MRNLNLNLNLSCVVASATSPLTSVSYTLISQTRRQTYWAASELLIVCGVLESTLKRHGYYCRSRRVPVGSNSRPRSCISCARGKAGCDNRRPECTRCINKAIECHYPTNNSRATTGPSTQHGDDTLNGLEKITPPSMADSPSVDIGQQTANNSGSMSLDGALILPDADFPNLGEDYLDWAGAGIGFADFLNGTQTNDPYLSPASPVVQQDFSPPSFSIPTPPSSTVRSLVQRPRRQAGAQRIANLILHTLKSYPLMMLRHKTLPPFIHPSLVSPDVEDVNIEPLTNCISLVHMISSEVQGSRKLFWKNVRMECERLFEEVR